jgi:hypothetical protein
MSKIRPIYYSGRRERINACLDGEILAMADVLNNERRLYSRSDLIARLILEEFNRVHPGTNVFEYISNKRKRMLNPSKYKDF